jgi:hypothetical protein
MDNPISQSSVEVSPMQLPVIQKELKKSVWNMRLDTDYYWMFELCMFLYFADRDCWLYYV